MFSYFKDRTESKNFYLLLGEGEGIDKLVEDFYLVMETDPKAKDCLVVHELSHGKVDPESKKKLKYFLAGWMGGPNLFVETYGPPRMRMRHAHINIGLREKDQWLYCMEKALKKSGLYPKERKKALLSFQALAMRIQNQD